MKPIEIIQKIRMIKPEALGVMNDEQAAVLLRVALTQIKSALKVTPSGRLPVVGFGVFVVKQINEKVIGAAKEKKRIVFRMAVGKKAVKKDTP
jgi:hypothetical protein